MATHTFCDGVQRRDFLKVGAVSGFGLGMGLPQFLAKAKEGDLNPKAKGKAAIFVRLGGGPTHMDTFDLKPDAPDTHRGEFKEIKTNVPGVRFCEHLPKLAKVADKFAILRGVSHTLAAHALGTQYLMTGNRPLPSLRYPSYGAVVSKEMESPKELPAFVAVPNQSNYPTGFLGVEYGPFETGSTPTAGQPIQVRGLALRGITLDDVDRRNNMVAKYDQAFGSFAQNDKILAGMDEFSAKAYQMMRSTKAREAFDLTKESAGITGMFDDQPFSQSCLLVSLARTSRLGAQKHRVVTKCDAYCCSWQQLSHLHKTDDDHAGEDATSYATPATTTNSCGTRGRRAKRTCRPL